MIVFFHPVARAALAAVRQWPIFNRCAIHSHVTAVSERKKDGQTIYAGE
jgi:hypothetical protein